MKSCPTCNRTYPDDTLAFCLADGSLLSAPYDPQATAVLPAATSFIPPAAETVAQTTERMVPPAAPAKNSSAPLYVLIGLLLLVIFIGGIGLIGAVLWRIPSGITGGSTPTPTPVKKPTPDDTPEHTPVTYKKRSDFSSDEDYGNYIQSVLTDRMRVREITDYFQIKTGFTGTYYKTADATSPPCYVIWDDSIDTTGVTVPTEAPSSAAKDHGYWVMWYDIEIVE